MIVIERRRQQASNSFMTSRRADDFIKRQRFRRNQNQGPGIRSNLGHNEAALWGKWENGTAWESTADASRKG
ncbi:Hypothetical protein NTJ_02494 [Nesidiocoris tenuis]|uniref:Uncharacterized protein n=1 Tax=Nesidiocoris tenuis TaxID=355587 RepID=A0ABN7AFM5_9HEMI|nr:Hypothetical protein NTJ_02494 [Nesidiocoris tenuis]